jgi:hypothetical protein
MELKLIRKIKTPKSTIGDLLIDDQYFCKILEDTDREITSEMPLEQIKAKKVHGQTAIPSGRYEIVLSYSNKFKKVLPELLNVPGYLGIRIHVGNTPANTQGCLLPGMWFTQDQVLNSTPVFNYLFSLLKTAAKKEKIFITIE